VAVSAFEASAEEVGIDFVFCSASAAEEPQHRSHP